MGDHDVKERSDEDEERQFMKALLADVRALEEMLERGMFESGLRRIGAEQEMFLVDPDLRPAPVAVELLEGVSDPRLTNELARFNLEANVSPRLFEGRCLRDLEAELVEVVKLSEEAAARHGARVVLAGILPTVRRTDLTMENMTPSPRYRAMNNTLLKMRGGDFHFLIKGVDELNTTHDNVMFESCNTSFQIHFQVGHAEFAKLYNVAQLVTAPVLAAGVNSPLFLGSRLWHETRVALFSSAVDDRSHGRGGRVLRPRVTFGDAWVKESPLEIFREQIARFRLLLSSPTDGDPLKELEAGRAPALRALRLHNGTVYRWNRICYGVVDNVAHLRIENRVLPAGPTILDEVANAAFFFGLMAGVTEEIGDPSSLMPFDVAKDNFFSAARHGLKAQFTWFEGRTVTAAELIAGELLPLARRGLEVAGIDAEDIERYLGVIEDRVRAEQTGASWALASLMQMEGAPPELRARRLAATMREHQRDGTPVHLWPVIGLGEIDHDAEDWRRAYQTVGQFMRTDLFTVRPNDLVDLAASVMDWERKRHVPVENDRGELVGLVTHRALLRLVARGGTVTGEPVLVEDLMIRRVVTVTPDTQTLDAMKMMREQQLTCLPVVDEGKLVGLVTESDLVAVSAGLLERFLRGDP